MAITGVTITRADETNGAIRAAVITLVGTAALGPVGPEGAVGPTGATGDTGPAGPIGEAATITVGTVSVGPAAVVNSGTSGEAILDFTIQTGATGATGPAGPASLALDNVGDVTITSATSGDLLKWNGSAWVNAAGYALLASPTFTGTPTLPTGTIGTTQTAGNNTTAVATTQFVRTEVSALVNGATATLDTLGEIATALGNDANLSATLTASIGLKSPLASPTFTGTVVLPATTSIGTVSDTEISYVDGVTSSIQTQLDAKVAKTTLTTTGDTFYASAANTPARLAIGATATVLTVTGGLPVWAAPAAAKWG